MPCCLYYTLYIQCKSFNTFNHNRRGLKREIQQERIPSFLHEKLKAIFVGKKEMVTRVSDAGIIRKSMMAVEYTVKNNIAGRCLSKANVESPPNITTQRHLFI